MKSEASAIAFLRESNCRVTKYRVALLQLFSHTDHPFSVGEILESLSEKDLTPNKTTVYREISYLVSQKVLRQIDLGDERKRYELADREHHHHLICQKCNIIEDVVIADDVAHIETKVKRQHKFVVTGHMLEFYGLCKRCQ